MEKFKINCNAVSSDQASIQSLAEQLKTIGEGIQNYEIPEDEDFNFTTPRSAIAANVLNSAEKIENTAKILNTVIENHTELQNNLTFDIYIQEKEKKATALAPSSGGSSSGSGYYSPSAAYSEAGAYYSEEATTIAEASGVTAAVSEVVPEPDPVVPETSKEEKEEPKEEKEIENTITFGEELVAPAIGFVLADDIEKKIDDRLEVTYDEENSFALVDDKYVVRCDEKLGRIGDAIVITTASGATYSCIIGDTFKAKEGETNSLEFFTNSKNGLTPTDDMPNKDDEIVKVDNYGSSDEKKFKIEKKKEEKEETPNESQEKESEEPKEKPETKKEDSDSETDDTKNNRFYDYEKIREMLYKFRNDNYNVTTPKVSIGGGNQVISTDIPPVVPAEPTVPEAPVTGAVETPSFNWESDIPTIVNRNNTSNITTGSEIPTGNNKDSYKANSNFIPKVGITSNNEEDKQREYIASNYAYKQIEDEEGDN